MGASAQGPITYVLDGLSWATSGAILVLLYFSPIKKEFDKNNNFVLVISDFYFLDSANNLKQQLVKETKINIFFVRKIINIYFI